MMAMSNPFLNKDALLQILEQENEHEEAENLIRCYEAFLPCLGRIALCNVDPLILKCISETLHSTFAYNSDWRVFAYKMGLNNSKIDSIACTLITKQELPLLMALTGPLKHMNKSFGDIIRVLIDEQRLDVLFKIKPLIEIMLEFKNENALYDGDNKDHFQPSAPPYEINEDDCENSGSKLPLIMCHKNDDEKFQANVCNETKLKSSPFSYNTEEKMNHSIISKSSPFSYHKNTEEKMNHSIISPNTSIILTPTNKILIPHATDDYEIGQELISFLNSNKFKAKLMSDLEGVFPVSENDAIKAILNYVDVVVLLLSKKFLQQILPHKFGNTSSQTREALNNRLLFQFLQNEYRNNNSFNLRVRSVMVPEMDWNLIKDEPLLCCALHLWKDDTKIINNLNTTCNLLFLLHKRNKNIKFT